MKTVTVSETGRLTLPADVRRAIGLEGDSEVEVEVDAAGEAIVLRPVVVLRREDAWAYTPEHRALLTRAHADSREGRVQRLRESDLTTFGA